MMMKTLILTVGFAGAMLMGFTPSASLAHDSETEHSHEIKSPEEMAHDARQDFRQEIKRREREKSKNRSFYSPPPKNKSGSGTQLMVKPKSTTNRPTSLWNN